jgi:ADP-ribose pyrophosphatase
MKVREDRVKGPRGEEAIFGLIIMKPGVTVLPMDDNHDVYLVREFKYGIGEPTLEAVSGAIESGETPEQAGLREVGEEACLIAAEWVDMGLVNPFTTIVNSPNHMFLARKLSKIRRRPEGAEPLELVKMPFADALQAVLNGAVTHAATCVLILKTHIFLQRSPQP